MDPQIIDYYNDMPSGAYVIEKMNEELSEVQLENEKLKERLDILEKSLIPIKHIVDRSGMEKCNDMEFIVEEELYSVLRNAISDNGDDEKELSLKYIFDHKKELVDILVNNLNQSELWCDQRIKSCLREYIPLKYVDGHWWETMIKGEDLCDTILDMIVYHIIVGVSEEYEKELQDENDIESLNINELFIFKCESCNLYHPCNKIYNEEDIYECVSCMEKI